MTTVHGSGGGVNLKKSTPATADASKILSGYTAWVNGVLLTGTAVEGKTVVQEMSGVYTHTFQFEGTPKAILAEFGYDKTVQTTYGRFMKILDMEVTESNGAPAQAAAFGYSSVTMKFTAQFGGNKSPYFRATAIY